MAREDKTRTADRAFAETRLSDARAYLQQADISLELVKVTAEPQPPSPLRS